MTFLTDKYLDFFGERFACERNEKESDDAYRERFLNHIKSALSEMGLKNTKNLSTLEEYILYFDDKTY